MNADDHQLIERTRKINKTLSMYVFALQEGAEISVDSQLDMASLLQALAETVRDRVGRPFAPNDLVIEVTQVHRTELGPGREPDAGV